MVIHVKLLLLRIDVGTFSERAVQMKSFPIKCAVNEQKWQTVSPYNT